MNNDYFNIIYNSLKSFFETETDKFIQWSNNFLKDNGQEVFNALTNFSPRRIISSIGNTVVSNLDAGYEWNWSRMSSSWAAIGDRYAKSDGIWPKIGMVLPSAVHAVLLTVSQAIGVLDGTINNAILPTLGIASDAIDSLSDTMQTIANNSHGNGFIVTMLTNAISIMADSGIANYKSGGVEGTSFGNKMESTWNKSDSNCFLQLITSSSSHYKINISNTTPLDPGTNSTNLYGTMLLGTPPIFNNIADPKNRSIINSFLRDARFLSLTPGYPKYNGNVYLQKSADNAYNQTNNPEEMLEYLLKNGVDSTVSKKDRRYYTFKASYDDYYAYLETMLNAIWLKMGLGSTTDSSTYNIFSFFNIKDDSGNINLNNANSLKTKYATSLGFYVNPAGILTESINTAQTGFGGSYASNVNDTAYAFNQITFLTGMGTGGSVKNTVRQVTNTLQTIANIKTFAADAMSNTIAALTSRTGILKKIAATAVGVGKDALKFYTETDSGAKLEAFATANGMKITYPELWSNTDFSKSTNINFEFISPYGDPLSIFKYVMVPFCALLCFAMPHQAAENGLVGPFFVRADIPGLFTTDLGLITDFNWTRGGSNELWTKDGLPRAISGSFTIADMYPYLAMTKRVSFLSANPNYSTWLNSLAGFHPIATDDQETDLMNYFKSMINRVNGENTTTGLWNKYSSQEQLKHANYANTPETQRIQADSKGARWLRGL